MSTSNEAQGMAEWRAVAQGVRNWGRWGPEDQLGTLNYISNKKVRQAASLVRKGACFTLSIPLDAYGPGTASGRRRNPIHVMTVDGGDEDLLKDIRGWGGPTEREMERHFESLMRFTDDYIIMPLQAGTQWDALAHCYYEGRLYNGFPSSSVTSLGATRNSVEGIAKRGIITRGVLLDIPRYRGIDRLAAGTIVYPDELDAVAASVGVTVEPGDILLVRTGWWRTFLETRDPAGWRANVPGLSWRCAEWLHGRQIAAVASDTHVVEVPTELPEVPYALHLLLLRDMGMIIGEMWDLDELALDCAADGVYEFQLAATPLLITGAVGSPLTPIAIK